MLEEVLHKRSAAAEAERKMVEEKQKVWNKGLKTSSSQPNRCLKEPKETSTAQKQNEALDKRPAEIKASKRPKQEKEIQNKEMSPSWKMSKEKLSRKHSKRKTHTNTARERPKQKVWRIEAIKRFKGKVLRNIGLRLRMSSPQKRDRCLKNKKRGLKNKDT